jgi:pimeloyl-ACP methyl ester carboxylesterase
MMRKPFFNLLIILSLLVASSCSLFDDGQLPVTNDAYLVNYNQVKAMPAQLIKTSFSQLGPEVSTLFTSKVKYDVVVYKISYKTTFKQREVVASGVVCIPLSLSQETFPILSFQNGTNTLNSEAPSANIDNQLFTLIQAVASFGYVVVIPDYLGFGTSTDIIHPYLEKNHTVKSVLDMYGAVREMAGQRYLKLNMNDDIYLMGYSQGAWASLALAQEIETNQAIPYNLKGTAVGGGPYDLRSLMSGILEENTYPMPVYLGYLVNSYIQSGSVSITYQDIFNPPFADRIQGLYNGMRSSEFINSQLSEEIAVLFKQEFRTGYLTDTKYTTFIAALQANSVSPWKTNSPLFIRHGAKDTFVPAAQSVALQQGFINQQVPATLINYAIYPLTDHSEGVTPFGLEALQWLLAQ